MIKIDQTKCISCGACVIICPVSAIVLCEGTAAADPLRCVDCGKCVSKCYMRAIILIKEAT